MSRCFFCPVKGASDLFTMVYGPEVEVPTSNYKVGQLRNYAAPFSAGNDCYHVKTKVSGFISPERVIDVSRTIDIDKLGSRYWETTLRGSKVQVTGLSPVKSLEFGDENWRRQWWFTGLINGSVETVRSQWGFFTYWDLWKWDVNWDDETATVYRSVEVTNPKYYETLSEAWANPGPIKWQLSSLNEDISRYITRTGYPSSASNAQSVALMECHNLLRYLEENLHKILIQMTNYGDLCQQAAEHTKPNTTNAIALALDLIKLPKDMHDVVDTLNGIKTSLFQLFRAKSRRPSMVHQVAKHSANALLSAKYGARLTYGDLGIMSNNILGNIPPKSKTSSQLNESIYVNGHRYEGFQRIQFNWTFSGFNAIAENLREHNIKFDLTDAWDLVPYSFVVDWFLGIGDALEKFETNNRMSKLDVENIWHTFKFNGSRTLELEGSRYTINNTLYCRRNLPHLLPGGISPSSQPVAHQHIVEEAALLVQRT